MTPLLTRETVMELQNRQRFRSEGWARDICELAAALLAAWDERDITDKLLLDEAKLSLDRLDRAESAAAKLAERDAAVAAALDAAAELCIQSAQEARADNGTGWASHSWLMTVARTIQSEITQPQADALARVRDEAVTVKPLVWETVPTGYGPETYEAYAATGFYQVFTDEDSACGAVFAEFATDQSQFSTVSARKVARVNGFAEAKAAAQADHDARIRAAIGGVE
jgi:hypothetical protein